MRSLAIALVLISGAAFAQASAKAETAPILSGLTSANDTAIWVHPTNVAFSLVFGTDILGGGLYSYGLDGGRREFLAFGPTRAVDVRYGLKLGLEVIDVVLAVTSNGDIHLYSPNRFNSLLAPLASGFPTGSTANAAALSFDSTDGGLKIFVADTAGRLTRYSAEEDDAGHLMPRLIDTLTLDSPIEGLVADDRTGRLFLTVANRGLYTQAFADGGIGTLTTIDKLDAGRLAGLAGVTLYPSADGGGYVIVSASQTSRFQVYSLGSGFPFVTSFNIVGDGGLNGATNSRGIDVMPASMGGNFKRGLFVAHDRNNPTGPNFKLVPWDEIASSGAVPLTVDPRVDPRGALLADAGFDAGTRCQPSDGGTVDGGADAGDCISGAGGGGGAAVRLPPGGSGGPTEEPGGCRCTQVDLLYPFAAAAWLLRRRRSRSAQ